MAEEQGERPAAFAHRAKAVTAAKEATFTPISPRGSETPAEQPEGHLRISLTNLHVDEMLQEWLQSGVVRSVREVGGDGSIKGGRSPTRPAGREYATHPTQVPRVPRTDHRPVRPDTPGSRGRVRPPENQQRSDRRMPGFRRFCGPLAGLALWNSGSSRPR